MDLSRMVVIDYETDNTRGLGLAYWHPDFRVTSASFLVDGQTMFTTDFKEMQDTLRYFIEEGYTIVTYNIAFDVAIMKYVFKEPKAFSLALDAWRLFCYVNPEAGDKHAKKKRKTSLPAAMEYLFGVVDYKRPYLDKIIEMGLAKTDKEAHANIGQLPDDLLLEYNNLDTINCLHVTTECLERLTAWGIDWEPDYKCFRREVELYADSYYRGIRVDRELMKQNIYILQKKINKSLDEIFKLSQVVQVEALINKPIVLTKHGIAAYKKFKELDKSYVLSETELSDAIEWMRQKKWVKFNPGSTKHKQKLFLDVMGFKVVRLTDKGSPQMNKAALKKYGDVGMMLIDLHKLVKQLEECHKIEILSRVTGRLHCSLRSGNTISGRTSSKA